MGATSALRYDDTRDPGPEDVALVVGVAGRSLTDDRGKECTGCGRAGIPVYWIVNLRENRVEVDSDPDPASGHRGSVIDRPGQAVPALIGGQVAGEIEVAELLP